MNLSNSIPARLFLLFVLLLACDSASQNSTVSGWDILQISPNVLCSMPYGNFRLNIYEHVNNYQSTTNRSKKRYFYDPIGILDHKSAKISYNNATKLTKMGFRIEMWTENVQSEIVSYLSNFISQKIKPNQVQVIPFDKVVLTSTEPSTTYFLSTDWHPYRLEKSIWFSLNCFHQKDCEELRNEMTQNSPEFNHLKLLFSLSSYTTQTKILSFGSENIVSNQMISELLKCKNADYAIITNEDETRLLSDMASHIISESFDDSEVVYPSSISKFHKDLKNFLVNSRFAIPKEYYDNIVKESLLCLNNQTDKILDPVSEEKSQNIEDHENREGVKKNLGDKSVLLSKINLMKMQRKSKEEFSTKFRYSTAVLSIFVRFVQFPTTKECAESMELKDLKNQYQNLKTDHEQLKSYHQTKTHVGLQNPQTNTELSSSDPNYQLVRSGQQRKENCNQQNLTNIQEFLDVQFTNIPGIELIPTPTEDREGSLAIQFNSGTRETWRNKAEELTKFLDGYKNQKSGDNFTSCSFEKGPIEGKICNFDIDFMSSYDPEDYFDYPRGRPCILLKLSQTTRWIPEPYDPNDLPATMPTDLKKHIISRAAKNRDEMKMIWVSCDGENARFREYMGPVSYKPFPGFPAYYFPYKNHSDYLSPIVALQLLRPEAGVVIKIECKVWAKNLVSSLHFGVLMDI